MIHTRLTAAASGMLRREIVRTRCTSCRHECHCTINPALPAAHKFLTAERCQLADCRGVLQIISVRAVCFRYFPLGAESYNVPAPDYTDPQA